MSDVHLIAACAFGLEAVVRRELESLGFTASVAQPGRVRFAAQNSDICRANIWLRTADRVLVEIAEFPAADFEQLFENVKSIDWSRWIPQQGAFPVVAKSRNSQLTSLPAVQRAVKKAMVEGLKRGHRCESLVESGPTYKTEVALLNDQATLTLDTTGPSLHKRGYRKLAAPAPLKETLAAAMVMLSFWKPGRPLIDPFCGSGTIPIEAALIGANIAPGIKRDFASSDWPMIGKESWQQARTQAQDLANAEGQLAMSVEKIIGTDHDEKVLSLARYHAKIAEVSDWIHWQQRSFDQLLSKRNYGCIVTNPPYGERLQNQKELNALYRSMPAVLQRLPTWSHFILTSFPQFEKLIETQADRRRKLYNGRIECTYYQFHGPRPTDNDDPGTAPVFGQLTAKADEQAELFAARLKKRARHLRKWPTKFGIPCYRIYERDIPEIPLIVDRYEDCLHLTEYERPHDRSPGEQGAWLDKMAAVAANTLEVPRKNVFVKSRTRQKGKTQHERIDQHGQFKSVHEGGLQFLVNLSDYVDTGLFLDHRITRSMVREEAEGKRFLNLFAYTGTFSVYAADGKALSTTTVDWSANYLEWAKKNFAANNITAGNHEFIRSDAMTFVSQLPNKPVFDLAVVDPPTFSNSKDAAKDWDVQRDHVELLNQLGRRMSPGGTVYFSTNFRRFKFDLEPIKAAKTIEISRQTVPDDFRNQRIHRCWKIFW